LQERDIGADPEPAELLEDGHHLRLGRLRHPGDWPTAPLSYNGCNRDHLLALGHPQVSTGGDLEGGVPRGDSSRAGPCHRNHARLICQLDLLGESGGVGESAVDDKIGDLIANSNNPTVGVLAHPGQVDVRITAKAKSLSEAHDLIRPVESKIRDLLGDNIFAEDEETLPGVVAKLLHQNKFLLSVCEDVTGGIASQMLFEALGRDFYEGLIVNHELEDSEISRMIPGYENLKKGSQEMADRMAIMIRENSKSELGLAIHAVVLQEEYVENLSRGQTFISITDGERFAKKSYNFAGYGIPDRTRMSLNSLDLLRRFLKRD